MNGNKSFDVTIVGLGPVGAILANLLGKLSLSVLVVEKSDRIHPKPRAIHFDGEVMRVFQNAGLAEEVVRIARPSHKGMHFVGSKNELLLTRKGIVGVGEQGWENSWYFFQPELEKVLRDGLKKYPNVTIKQNETVEEIVGGECFVQIVTSQGESKTKKKYETAWLVGCDGTKSLVASKISDEIVDFGLNEKWLVVDLKIKASSLNEVNLPDHTVQHCDPLRPMTRCFINSRRRRWEIMILPGEDKDEVFSEQHIWRILKPWIGPQQAKIERSQIYTFHSLIKKSWRSGRLVLAGDSAHQSPPFLGQGLCAGVRDAACLAWRLDLLVRKKVGEKTLDSYVSERKAHASEFIDLAVKCGKLISSGNTRLIKSFFIGKDLRNSSFDFPKPQLGSGDWIPGDTPLGQISPQFVWGKNSRSDDFSLYSFILFHTGDVISDLSSKEIKTINHLNINLVKANRKIKKWLDSLGAKSALIRPDRYLYGIASDREGLLSVINHIENTFSLPN